MSIRVNKVSAEIAKTLCDLYISPKYLTFERVCFANSVKHLGLTPRAVSEYIHFAIKMNIIDDEKANRIRNKSIKNAERKRGRSSLNTKAFYDELFKERLKDKRDFPKGHSFIDETPYSNKNQQGEQLSLI